MIESPQGLTGTTVASHSCCAKLQAMKRLNMLMLCWCVFSNYFSIYKFDGTLEVSIQIPCRSLKDYSNSSTPSPPTAMNSMDSVVTGLSNLKFSPYAKYSKTEPIRIDQKVFSHIQII